MNKKKQSHRHRPSAPQKTSAGATVSLADALKLGASHLQAGRLDEAEKVYQAILKAAPQQPEALHQCGRIAAQRGQYPEALSLLKAALLAKSDVDRYWLGYAEALLAADQPDAAHFVMSEGRKRGLQGEAADALDARIEPLWASRPDIALLEELDRAGQIDTLEQEARRQIERFGRVPTLVHKLGVALLKQKRDTEALACLEEVKTALADNVNVWNQIGLALNHLERYDEAHAAFEKALSLKPDGVDIYANIGDNLNDAGRFEESLPWLEKALAINPKARAARINRVIALVELQRAEEAESAIEALIAEGEKTPQILHCYSQSLRERGEIKEAKRVLTQILEIDASYVPALNAMGSIYVEYGKFDEAQAMFDQALAIDPDNVGAWASLVTVRKMTPEDRPWLEKAEQLLAKGLPKTRESGLRFAMGKFCDDTKDYDNAFAHYQRGNELKKTFGKPYLREYHAAVIDHLIHAYDIQVMHTRQPGSSDSMRPVLIVGMPRSGTSLTEQILASHPDTFGAGELRYWGQQMERHRKAICTAGFDEALVRQAAQGYLEELQSHSDSATRVVDKMPGNFMSVGFIHSVFPNARILHTMRNPVDTCLSIYFQNFNLGHTYASDLEDLAVYYRQYHRLMAHWRKVMPKDRFLELPYEQLVEDQEGWSRKIIEFIGLEWDERCLEFYKTERKVGTASNWQARQPIYKTSKERWRNYERHIGPLLPLLELYDPERGQL
jgi:tetratricopeptide (TPR) repeat protein